MATRRQKFLSLQAMRPARPSIWDCFAKTRPSGIAGSRAAWSAKGMDRAPCKCRSSGRAHTESARRGKGRTIVDPFDPKAGRSRPTSVIRHQQNSSSPRAVLVSAWPILGQPNCQRASCRGHAPRVYHPHEPAAAPPNPALSAGRFGSRPLQPVELSIASTFEVKCRPRQEPAVRFHRMPPGLAGAFADTSTEAGRPPATAGEAGAHPP